MADPVNIDAYRPANSAAPLNTTGGDGTSGGMNAITREEMDAKLSASEARIDGTLGRIEETLRHMPSTSYLLTSAVGSTVAVIGILIAILAFGGDRFSGGVEVGTASVDRKFGIDQIASENVQQSKDIQTLSTKVDSVLETLKTLQPIKPPPSDE